VQFVCLSLQQEVACWSVPASIHAWIWGRDRLFIPKVCLFPPHFVLYFSYPFWGEMCRSRIASTGQYGYLDDVSLLPRVLLRPRNSRACRPA